MNLGDCEHCGEPIFGDSVGVMGARMHPACAVEFQKEYEAHLKGEKDNEASSHPSR